MLKLYNLNSNNGKQNPTIVNGKKIYTRNFIEQWNYAQKCLLFKNSSEICIKIIVKVVENLPNVGEECI